MANNHESGQLGTPQPEETDFLCPGCDLPNSASNMVQCDTCQAWWHQTCAGVTESVEKRPWSCKFCVPVQNTRAPSTSSSKARRRDLQLQQLEAKRALESQARKLKLQAKLEELDAEKIYVDERFNLLQEQMDSDDSEVSGFEIDPDESQVQSWLESTPESEGAASEVVLSETSRNQGDQQQPHTSSTVTLTTSDRQRRYTGAFPRSNTSAQESSSSRNLWSKSHAWSIMGVHQWESVMLQQGVLRMQDPKSRASIANPGTEATESNSRRQGVEKQPTTEPASYRRASLPDRHFPIPHLVDNSSGSQPGPSKEHPPSLQSTKSKVQLNSTPKLNAGCGFRGPSGAQPKGGNIGTRNQASLGGTGEPSFSRPMSANRNSHPPPLNPLQQTQGRNIPLNTLPRPINDYNAHVNDHLEPYIKQLGLGPNELPVVANVMTSYQPSPSQLATRQVMNRPLPEFSGNPADWPLFISIFTNTTLACGFNPAENLDRLQRSLKGAALEAVRSKLLLPESVPQIIDTLRSLFGRPELLIDSLLTKVRSLPAPKADKLETLMEFGIAVQSLCDHLVAANQRAHLSNPTLMSELVGRLPTQQQLEWSDFSVEFSEVNMEIFGVFMAKLVKTASRVTRYSGSQLKEEKYKPKRGAVNTHTETPREVPKNMPDKKKCPACSRDHRLRDCSKFKSFDVDGRWHFVQQYNICRICLFPHGRRSCRSSSRCGVNACTNRHHPLLHSTKPVAASGTQDNSPSHPVASGNFSHSASEVPFLFRILPITVHGNGNSKEVFAFIDEGSALTLVEEALVKELGIEGTPRELCLQWTGKVSRTERESKVIDLQVSSVTGLKATLKETRTVKKLGLTSQSLNFESLTKQYSHLKGLPVRSYSNATPRVLIGVNNIHLTVPLKIKEGLFHEPKATKTRMGWCVYGGVSTGRSTPLLNYHACSCTSDETLHNIVRDYFSLEEAGVYPSVQIESEADKRARRIMQDTSSRVGDRFQTGLLWRCDDFELPDSYPMAVKRLECLERKLNRHPQLRENVIQQLKNYQAKGYAHRATEEELLNSDPRRVWYLPLGVVTNPKKPSKVRLIWDASATVDQISLNKMLLKGPDELTTLPHVLFRFRQFPVAVCADIAEMFHQIQIIQADRQSQRFLWRTDPQEPPEVYVMDVATFGSTCSPATAQYIKNRNAQEFEKVYPRAVEAIVKCHYVDDYFDSFETELEAAKVAPEVKMIHAKGGFNLRDWRSNRPEVLQHLDGGTTSQPKDLSIESSHGFERVLGMHWLPQEDTLSYSTVLPSEINEVIATKTPPTKRQLLRCLMSFFDPLGLLAAFVVYGKVLLQDVWRFGTSWDEKIDERSFEKWQKWIEYFPKIESLRIPRCYFSEIRTSHYQSLELHIFVDASEDAYAAVAYFRISYREEFKCNLISAKTKVAPLKHCSIPRLELMAAVLGTRLKKFVMEGHTVIPRRVIFWSDSSTVLSWIQSDHRRYSQFVACRVGEILSTTNITDWRWVPSKLNIADHATKWALGPQLQADDTWFSGPEFLQKTEREWPQPRKLTSTPEELKATCVHHVPVDLEVVVAFSRFSKWERLLRSMSFVYRFLDRYLNGFPIRARLPRGHFPGPQEELLAAENALFRMVQMQAFPEEVALLKANQDLPTKCQATIPKSSKLYKLTPYLDERGVLRIDGRVGAAKNVSTGAKFPVILDKDHPVTELIVHYYHQKYLHANFETVVNELRQHFHISQIRPTVKRVIRKCQWCKIYKSKPKIPKMAPLPEARLASYVRPFSFVGLDLFGPVLVKVGRSSVKRWIALFTCMTIRAVHVEVVYTLSTKSCIMGIRRFIGRRGAPIEIHSDNGTNFRGADNILQQQILKFHEDMAATFTNTSTKWVFIPPGTPHMGGCWERMVRSVKTALEASIQDGRKLDDEALYTLIVDAEGIVNSRPLTYLPLESEENEALTPNHFLLGSSTGVKQPPMNFIDLGRTSNRTWNLIQNQLDGFWRRWIREYLPTITKRTKWFGEVKPVAAGDLVVVVNEGRRNGWVRGKVLEVILGSDGRVRKAIIQTTRGLSRQAVSKLAVLDVLPTCNKGSPASSTCVTGGRMLTTGSTAGGALCDEDRRCQSSDV
ncbi:uncharacterized protein LOC129753322 [Uranotaenia lowii]|uniref:uncharacterized protein LOC129753322 n=1 Tax=Uranotaenia lowii TaxID=190385 RepID=UPI00247ACACC|nr:uncharacterized protein LOC129753322 [Uranotaenia lowii]